MSKYLESWKTFSSKSYHDNVIIHFVISLVSYFLHLNIPKYFIKLAIVSIIVKR